MEKYKATFGSWYERFIPIIASSEFERLANIIAKLRKFQPVYPERADVFKCFRETDLEKTSIIIWNDEPYANKVSDGLAFSAKDALNTPYILSRFQGEIENQIYGGLNLDLDNDLSYLAKQGVLLYNSNLTVSTTSHDDHWKWFNYEFVDLVNNLDWPVHVISIGELSKQYTQFLTCSVHQIDHPVMPYWDADNCFIKANNFLRTNYGPLTTIKW
jgi:uracil DNA glycosylase